MTSKKSIEPEFVWRYGRRILAKDGVARVFANWTQANNAAAKHGGVAFQSQVSQRFLVEIPDKVFTDEEQEA